MNDSEPYHQSPEEHEGPANGPLGAPEQNASGHHRNFENTGRPDVKGSTVDRSSETAPQHIAFKEPHPVKGKAIGDKSRKVDLEKWDRSRSPIRRQRSTATRIQTRRANSEPAPSKKRSKSHRHDRNNAEHLPPINLQTLRELDLGEIYENGKLRHDVVFDPALHFRPNNEGHRGLKKRVEADVYWRKVYQEILSLENDLRVGRKTDLPPKKLPQVFHTMRDILMTLVPKEDRDSIQAVLDPDLMMQELSHGILDFVKYAKWLAALLKAHCAPMRDISVEQIVKTITRGAQTGNMLDLVEGLRLIFLVLEAMKLDVANHQIRTLRPHLIYSSIVFEQTFFQAQIDNRQFDLSSSRKWYKQAFEEQWKTKGSKPEYEEAFVNAAVDMLLPSQKSNFHSSFVFDVERLAGYRDDLSDAVCLKICGLLFNQLLGGKPITEDTMEKLNASILSILGDDGTKAWMRHKESLALHLVQSVCLLKGKQIRIEDIRLAEGWLEKNLTPSSRVYCLVERMVMDEVKEVVWRTFKEWSTSMTFPVGFTAEVRGAPHEVQSVGQRISYVLFMNWRVFRQAYKSATEDLLAPFDLREEHHLVVRSPTTTASQFCLASISLHSTPR